MLMHTRRGWLAVLALCLLVAGCDLGVGGGAVGGGNGPTPIPGTPTPNAALVATGTGTVTLGKTQEYRLGNFSATAVVATAKGLVVAGTPNAVGNTALAYLPFTGGTVTALGKASPASDGSVRGIPRFGAAGDWAVYAQATILGTAWQLVAVQLSTGMATVLDDATQEGGSALLATAFATDGTDVVWAVPVAGQTTTLLHAYDLATGTARPLLSVPTNISDVLLANRLLYYRTAAFTGGQNVSTSWLWWLNQPKPQQIMAKVAGTIALNSRYLVWDDANTVTLTLYDLTTGQATTQWIKNCTSPSIAWDRPYVVCGDDTADVYRVVRTPAGTTAAFGARARGGLGNLANGRVYWIPEPNVSANTVVDAFDLPNS